MATAVGTMQTMPDILSVKTSTNYMFSYEIWSDNVGHAIVTEVCCGWLKSIDNKCQCVSAKTIVVATAQWQ